MHVSSGACMLSVLSFSILSAAPPQDDAGRPGEIQLAVTAGEPLRLALTKRVPKRPGAEVEAKVIDPVYAFDRQVIPAGTVVLGRVSKGSADT